MNVRIFKPSKNVMQSGRGKTHSWVLEYETSSTRQPENLMGWTSSGDTLNQVQIRFSSQEDAVSFAKGKGWNYTVLPEHDRQLKPRNYGDNFKYIPYTQDERA
jgi:ETC complex I subunit conserved region